MVIDRSSSMKNIATRILGALTAAGALSLCGALIHAQSYQVRRRTVLLPRIKSQKNATTASTLRIVHISDTHLLAHQRRRRAFLESLAELSPDFIVLTGDLIAADSAIPALLADLEPLLSIPGAFVFGSNDYFGPELKNPLRYLRGHTGTDVEKKASAGHRLATEELRSGLTSGGWIDLNNARHQLNVNDWTLDLVGIDDPHIGLHQMPQPLNVASASTGPALRLALAHAPYTWVLDMMDDDDATLAFAGHTHGGQVNLPGSHALVTNCDLPRRYANGLFEWPPPKNHLEEPHVVKRNGTVVAHDNMLVNISAGIGTSPFTPIRTFCAPEAIVLDIVAV
ncbi:metallophosphoesterase [Arcanobacterium phocae]|nr:metallophosphoesterase [Arcanobacterium phocae]